MRERLRKNPRRRTDIASGEWVRDEQGAYVNADGWRIKLIAQGCWEITRPNGFKADAQHVWPSLDAAKDHVDNHLARQGVA